MASSEETLVPDLTEEELREAAAMYTLYAAREAFAGSEAAGRGDVDAGAWTERAEGARVIAGAAHGGNAEFHKVIGPRR